MRILIAGGFRFPWYEMACAEALQALGHEVHRFSWAPFFRRSILGKLEDHFTVVGPEACRAQRALERVTADSRPDVLWIWRGTHVTQEFLGNLRAKYRTLRLVSYNNDDPFSPLYDRGTVHQRRLWRHFLAAIPAYDLHFVYRPLNVEEYYAAGAKRVEVLPPYFVPELHRPLPLSDAEKERYSCDCVFVGHFEPDGRDLVLLALVGAGLRVRVYGHGWPCRLIRAVNGQSVVCQPVYGDEYAKVIGAAKLALAFVSRINRDGYTRRHFEIPACGGVLFSERTVAVLELYQEDREIVCFGSPEEACVKALGLVADPVRRKAISDAGLGRVWSSGHDVVSRMKRWTEAVGDTYASCT